MEYCKDVELLDRLHSKFLKVDGGKWVFMGVCVGRVGIFVRKRGITRWILGVLGCMKVGCVGVEVDHLFQ